MSPVSGHMPLTADYSHARSHFLLRAPETLHLRVFSSTPSPPMGPTEVLSSRCSRRQPSDKHGWGSEGQHPSSLVSGLGRMFCTMPQVSSAECGLQCLAKVPEGLTVDCPELICSPRHLLPIPFLPLSCSRTGVFRGRLPDKTLALESVSQHLLLREPGLRDRTVLTRWGQKLPENAAHTEDARQRPRTRDAPATASCWQAPGFHMSFRASPCGPKHPFPLDLRRPIWCNARSPLQGPPALALTERGSQPRGQQTVPIPHCHCLRIAFWQLPLCSCLPAGLRPGPPPGDVNSSPLSA